MAPGRVVDYSIAELTNEHPQLQRFRFCPCPVQSLQLYCVFLLSPCSLEGACSAPGAAGPGQLCGTYMDPSSPGSRLRKDRREDSVRKGTLKARNKKRKPVDPTL